MFLKKVRHSCLHPYRFFNRSTQSYMIQPCGRCYGCVNSKAASNDLLIQAHASKFRFTAFVTLTFDMEHIPLASLVDVNDITYLVDYHNFDVILGEFPFISDSEKDVLYSKVIPLNGKSFPYHTLPYLDYSLPRLFLISLRQRIKQKRSKAFTTFLTSDNLVKQTYKYITNNFYTDEKITYYMVGEYGTNSLRPHFHFLFFFNKYETLQALRHFIPQVWTYGRTDFQIAHGSASSYLASYVSSNSLLPKIYQSKQIRPCSRHSLFFGFKTMEDNIQKIQPSSSCFSLSFDISANGKSKSCLFSPSFINSIYPKTIGFSSSSSRLLYQRYTCYLKAVREYPYASLIDVARHAYWDVFQGSIPQFLIDCGYNDTDYNPKLHDSPLSENSIYRLLLVSSKFLNLCYTLNFSYLDYLQCILDFYNKKSYFHFKELLQSLEDLSSSSLYTDVIADYYSDPDSVYSTHSAYYDVLYNESVNLFNHNIKHKTLKDIINPI